MGPVGALPVYRWAVLFMDVQQICLTSLFTHTLSLQPFDVFHETIGFSLLVTAFFNLFDLLAVPSIVRFPNLILKNSQHHHQSVQWYLANTSLFERFFHYFYSFCCCLIFYGIWREASDNQSKK